MRTTTPIQLRFNDIDMAGHAHNAVYLSWFEQARMELLRTFIERKHDWKVHGLIVARNEVDYRGPVHLSEHVEVDCWCDRLGSKSFDLRYALYVVNDPSAGSGHSRQLRTEGRSVMVCYDYTTNGTIAIPNAWRAALSRMMEPGQKPNA